MIPARDFHKVIRSTRVGFIFLLLSYPMRPIINKHRGASNMKYTAFSTPSDPFKHARVFHTSRIHDVVNDGLNADGGI